MVIGDALNRDSNRESRAFVRVFIDDSKSTHVNYRVVGADLAARVYGSKKVTLYVHYIVGDEREEAVRESLTAHTPVPEAAPGSYEPTVALSGYGWKYIVEHQDPPDPAGELFEMSRFFGKPTPQQVVELWNMIEPGSADRICLAAGRANAPNVKLSRVVTRSVTGQNC